MTEDRENLDKTEVLQDTHLRVDVGGEDGPTIRTLGAALFALQVAGCGADLPLKVIVRDFGTSIEAAWTVQAWQVGADGGYRVIEES